jgi:hypothetical protein
LTEGFDFVGDGEECGHAVVAFERVMPWFNLSATYIGLAFVGRCNWLKPIVRFADPQRMRRMLSHSNYLTFCEGIRAY